MRKLTPAMERAMETAEATGYVEPWEIGCATAVGLVERGLLREEQPGTGRHYLATSREDDHLWALVEHLRRSRDDFDYLTDEQFEAMVKVLISAARRPQMYAARVDVIEFMQGLR